MGDFELADYCFYGVRKSNGSEDELGFLQFVSDDFH